MLCPMCLAMPNRHGNMPLLTVITSVFCGAFCGYYLGSFIYNPWIANLIDWFHYREAIKSVRLWFTNEYGILMIFIGAFTPNSI